MEYINSLNKGGDSSVIPDFNIILLGYAGGGKSSIVRQFLQNSFSDVYIPTVEETYTSVLQTLNGSCIRLVLTDTAGLHPFPAMRELRMRSGHMFLLVFSLDSKKSFENALCLCSEVKRVKGEDTSIIFVGNKEDLVLVNSSDKYKENAAFSLTSHYVDVEATASLLDTLNMPYITTSALRGTNILELFQMVLWPAFMVSSGLMRLQDISKMQNLLNNSQIVFPKIHNKRTPYRPWKHFSDGKACLRSRQECDRAQQGITRKISATELRSRTFSYLENDWMQKSSLSNLHRKLSTGSRFLFSSISPRKSSTESINRSGIRSHSVDNSSMRTINREEIYPATFYSFASAFEKRSRSLNNNFEIENDGKETGNHARIRYGKHLSPQPKVSRSDLGLFDLSAYTLSFVQEIGKSMNREDGNLMRAPEIPTLSSDTKCEGEGICIRAQRNFSKVEIKISEFDDSRDVTQNSFAKNQEEITYLIAGFEDLSGSDIKLTEVTDFSVDRDKRKRACRIN